MMMMPPLPTTPSPPHTHLDPLPPNRRAAKTAYLTTMLLSVCDAVLPLAVLIGAAAAPLRARIAALHQGVQLEVPLEALQVGQLAELAALRKVLAAQREELAALRKELARERAMAQNQSIQRSAAVQTQLQVGQLVDMMAQQQQQMAVVARRLQVPLEELPA